MSEGTASAERAGAAHPKGLTTLALLQANYDAGRDYLSMFLPFVLDTIRVRDAENFSTAELQDDVLERHGIRIPMDALDVVLTRAKKKKAVVREGGRYFRQPDIYRGSDIIDLESERQAIEEEQERLGEAFAAYASNSQLVDVDFAGDGIELLLGFLKQYEVETALGDFVPIEIPASPSLDRAEEVGTAKFIRDKCLPNDALRASLERLLEGFVLQNALFLRDIASPRKDFLDLSVYLDTPFLFDVLGLTGDANLRPTREALDLLKGVKADLRVFRRTLNEMKIVLRMFEDHLATTQGRRELRPTAMTRHLLQNHYTPSGIRQILALLETQIERLGIKIVETPEREPLLTFDEKKLGRYLTELGGSPSDSRVRHDVNCAAAILIERDGRLPENLENARAVMATTSPRVIETIRRWYEDEGLHGVPPFVNYRKLSSLAWLRNPSPDTELEMAELSSLCSAAIRPSRRIWGSFTNRLEELLESEEITSDEAVAAVASDLTDEVLSDYEPKEELDAADAREAVERVKEELRADAAEDTEKLRNLEINIRYIAEKAAEWTAHFVTGFLFVAVGAGLYFAVVRRTNKPGLAWIPVIILSVATAINLWRGHHLGNLHDFVKRRVESMLRTQLSKAADFFLNRGAGDR